MARVQKEDPVIVVGSGFGGLAAAVRMRALGYEVKVLEARDQPGGRASVFLRDGYSFDAGPTVITAPYLFAELFELVGLAAGRFFSFFYSYHHFRRGAYKLLSICS